MKELLSRLQNGKQALGGEPVSVGHLADLHGESAQGAMLLFLSVLTILPIPFSGLVFSLGIFAVAWMIWQKDTSHGLPEFVCKVPVPPAAARKLIDTLSWIYGMAQRFNKPRLSHLTEPSQRFWMVPFIALMGFIIFLPIPLGNGTPAVALILLGLGMMTRDGLAVVLSWVVGVGAVGMLAFLIWTANWAIHAVT